LLSKPDFAAAGEAAFDQAQVDSAHPTQESEQASSPQDISRQKQTSQDYGLMERCAQRRAEGNALVSNADYEAAKAMYDKALQDVDTLYSDPKVNLSQEKVVEIIQLEAAAKVNKALCLLKLGDPRGCIEAAREVASGPSPVPTRVRSCIDGSYSDQIRPNLLDKATLRMIQGHVALQDFDQAEMLIETALDNESRCPDLHKTFKLEMKKVKKLKKQALQGDKKKWAGFFSKLEEGGGYMTAEDEARIKKDLEEEKRKLAEPENNGVCLGDAGPNASEWASL